MTEGTLGRDFHHRYARARKSLLNETFSSPSLLFPSRSRSTATLQGNSTTQSQGPRSLYIMVPIAKALAAVIAAIATPAMGAPSHAIARAGAAATLLDKPTVNPPVTNLDEYLLRQLMYAKPEITPWACDLGKPNGCFVSTYCKDIFLKENHSLKYIDMFDVMYEDVCYHVLETRRR